MTILWLLAQAFAVVGVLVLFSRLGNVSNRLTGLEGDNRRLIAALNAAEGLARTQPVPPLPAGEKPVVAETAPVGVPPPDPVVRTPTPDIPPSPADVPPVAAARVPAAPVAAPPKKLEWERLLGVNLPVWLGAFALAIGGFFFAAWAIETGLFSPLFRVLGALLLGLLLLAAAEFVRQRVVRDNGPAIAAALASAGIATLYATAYIASVFYELVPGNIGFLGMALVTAAAIAIALRFGQIVAVVGLLGGYLAPAWYSTAEPSAFILFSYLTAVLIAIFAVIRFRDWWHLTIPALLGPLLWILIWGSSPLLFTEQFWAAAFVIAVPIVVTIAAVPVWVGNTETVSLANSGRTITSASQAVFFSFSVAALGLLLFLGQSDFSIAFWQAQIAFAALAVAIAFARPWSMRLVPFAPLAGVALALLGRRSGIDPAPALVTAALAAIFGFWALDQFRRLREPWRWAIVVAALAVYFFAIALFQVTGWQAVLENRHVWAQASLALAAAMIGLMSFFAPKVADPIQRDGVYAALGAAATAFVSLVVVIELDPILYPAAAAIEVLGLAAIHARVPVRGLRILAAALTGIYLVLIAGSGADIAYGPLSFVLAKSLADAPLLLLILPGLAFLGAATLFHRSSPTRLTHVLDIAAIAMLALGLIYQFVPDLADVPFADAHIAAAKIVLPELALAALAVFGGNWFGRPILYRCGVVLTVVIEVVMVLTLMTPVYSFWPTLNLPGVPVFNIALLSLGLPSLALLGLGWSIRRDTSLTVMYVGRGISVIAALLLYTLMLLDIRHAFHPGLLQGPTSDAEFYAYSIGTLAFGIVLLIIGVVLRNLGARALSLVFVVLAMLKVFLFDASALEGLWRVLSFFGMGLAFLAISWFYARYVFGIRPKAAVPPPGAPPSSS